MHKKIQITLTLLSFLVFVLSCNGQDQKESVRTTLRQNPSDTIAVVVSQETPSTIVKKEDFDPYFQGTTADTSSKGPNVITRNIIQDRAGNYWLATWDGIIKYDGEIFTNYTNKNRLRRYRVFSILEDRLGRIWFGTIGAGVYLKDGDSFISYTKKEGLVGNDIGCIYEDSKGNIWIGTQSGISVFDGKNFKNYTNLDGLLNEDINSILEDNSGKIWIGSRGEACTFDGIKFTKLRDESDRSFVNIRSIIMDKNGSIWFGGNPGLWKFSDNTFRKMMTNFTGYIFEDRQGNIWTSSDSGTNQEWVLTKYPRNFLNSPIPTSFPIYQEADMFFGITQDQNGDIWFGTLRGIVHFDGTTFNRYR